MDNFSEAGLLGSGSSFSFSFFLSFLFLYFFARNASFIFCDVEHDLDIARDEAAVARRFSLFLCDS